MPCYKDTLDCPLNEIHSRFAFFPTTDMNANSLFFEPYWEYGIFCEVGFFALRGSKKEYPTKADFWKSIRFRIPTLVDEVYRL